MVAVGGGARLRPDHRAPAGIDLVSSLETKILAQDSISSRTGTEYLVGMSFRQSIVINRRL